MSTIYEKITQIENLLCELREEIVSSESDVDNLCDVFSKNTLNEKNESEEKNEYNNFWKSIEGKDGKTQLVQYKKKKSPEYILKFIAIGGGSKMGTTLEQFARFRFKNLRKRDKGPDETGYDQILQVGEKKIYIEQKSSGHWGEDYKWQHVEEKHKWNMLLLCGIDYNEVKFWVMDRTTFKLLISEGKITNQGNKAADSSQGVWFNYSDVKEYITEINTAEELLEFASSLEII